MDFKITQRAHLMIVSGQKDYVSRWNSCDAFGYDAPHDAPAPDAPHVPKPQF